MSIPVQSRCPSNFEHNFEHNYAWSTFASEVSTTALMAA